MENLTWANVVAALPVAGDIATVLIALFALIATRSQANSAKHQAELTRLHNKLSVKPVLQFRAAWTVNRQAQGKPDGVEVIYTIKNNGLGPGTLTDLSVKDRDGRTIELNEGEQHKVERLLALMFPEGNAVYVVPQQYWPVGRVILPQEEVTIAKIFFHKVHCLEEGWKPATRASVLAVPKALGTDYHLSYTWQSMYDEVWTDNEEY